MQQAHEEVTFERLGLRGDILRGRESRFAVEISPAYEISVTVLKAITQFKSSLSEVFVYCTSK